MSVPRYRADLRRTKAELFEGEPPQAEAAVHGHEATARPARGGKGLRDAPSSAAKAAYGEQGSYDVGYGRPPVGTRFRPGRSGNPKGRPKGVNNLATDVQQVLTIPTKVTSDGTTRSMPTQKVALLRLREKALAGDPRALDRLVELASRYNNEPAPVATVLSRDDKEALDIMIARIRSGAFIADPDEDTAGSRQSLPGSTEDDDLPEGGCQP